jgi:predicted outer membrane protein
MNRSYTKYDGAEVVETGLIDVEWEDVRRERNAALRITDWRAVKDRTMSQAWKDYRQALRDLPQDFETANDAADNWPEAPE